MTSQIYKMAAAFFLLARGSQAALRRTHMNSSLTAGRERYLKVHVRLRTAAKQHFSRYVLCFLLPSCECVDYLWVVKHWQTFLPVCSHTGCIWEDLCVAKLISLAKEKTSSSKTSLKPKYRIYVVYSLHPVSLPERKIRLAAWNWLSEFLQKEPEIMIDSPRRAVVSNYTDEAVSSLLPRQKMASYWETE